MNAFAAIGGFLLIAGSAQALTLSINAIQPRGANQSIQFREQAGRSMWEKFRKKDPACAWTFSQRVDLDNDGLLDTVDVHAELRGASRQQFDIGKGSLDARPQGKQLRLSISGIEYTLGTGQSGSGYFRGFSSVKLSEAQGIRINGKNHAQALRQHAIGIKRRSLTIEPLADGQSLATLEGIEFQVEADPAKPGPQDATSSVAHTSLKCLVPLILLLLRKGKPDNEKSAA